ncbi:MAG: hypothetical protein EP338_12745 [Bacteroidetes bacterium]|nr:MAG: hypothetical protein EP338_12745 [Bacteroidota bacterium]
MRRLGLLEQGQFSTAYYKSFLEEMRSRENDSFEIEHIPCDFESLNVHLPDQFHELKPRLRKILSGIDFQRFSAVIIPNMTLHLTLDRLQLAEWEESKLIHPFKVALRRLKKEGVEEITLAGTRHTSNHPEIKSYFEKGGINVCFASEESIRVFDDLRQEVYRSGANDTLKKELEDELRNYPNPLLLCTELSVIAPKNVYDLSKMQMEECLLS